MNRPAGTSSDVKAAAPGHGSMEGVLRYWILTTEYPPLHGGGISTYCFYTGRMLARYRYRVTVFVSDADVEDHATEDRDAVRLIRFNPERSGFQDALGYSARLSYAFAQIVKMFSESESPPDIIECQDYLGIAYYLIQFKHLGYSFVKEVPIVITLHSPAFLYLEYNRVSTYSFPDYWTGEMEKQALKGADLLIAPSAFIAGEISKRLDLSEKVTEILPNPFLLTEEVPAFSFRRNKIVYYGKLSPQKGTFEMLRYFKQLWDNGFRHPLHLIGGTDIVYHPEKKTMGQMLESLYAPYIRKGLMVHHGKIRPHQLREFLQDAHVVIFPSVVDNLPYAVMEAMSLGKIVLASRQGGQREMIEEGISGFLFDHQVPGSFAEKLLDVLALPEAELKRISGNARTAVETRYNFEKIGAVKTQLISTLVNAKRSLDIFPFVHQEPVAAIPSVMSAQGLLSVVVPYYNMGAYIRETISSILKSTYANMEVILVNDGSTDEASIQKLEELKKNDRVIILHQDNKGLAQTRNTGAQLARGEYLAFLDADDKVAPTYYEKAINVLSVKENVFFVGAWTRYFGNSRKTWPTFTPQPPYALVHNPVNSSALVYKRAAFLAAGLNDAGLESGLEDYESVISMLRHGFNGVVLPEVLFHYRVRTGSFFRQATKEKLLYANRYIVNKHAPYVHKFSTEMIHLLHANGPGYLFDNPTFEVSVSSTVKTENRFVTELKSLIKKNEKLKRMALRLASKMQSIW